MYTSVNAPNFSGIPRSKNRYHARVRANNANAGDKNASQPAERDVYNFTYKGSDGRMKATFEQAFKSSSAQGPSTLASAPWDISYQMGEQYLVWNDELKTKLLTRVAGNKLNISDEEAAERIERLQLLIPDISTKMASMQPQIIVRLLKDLDLIPGRLLSLKQIFPEADVLKLAMREPNLVLGFETADVQSRADQLRDLLPSLNIDRLVEEHPSMLDVDELKKAINEAARIMPSLNVEKTMGSDPAMIMSFQRGASLIPYDLPYPEDEEEERKNAKGNDDDEYAAYYK